MMLFVWSYVSFGQLQYKDSIWLPIYVKDSTQLSYQLSESGYESLFYKSVHVPVYEPSDSYSISPLAQELSDILLQTGLNASYQTSEVKGTELEQSLRSIEKFSFPFASCITSKLAEQLGLITNKPVVVAHEGQLQLQTVVDSTIISTRKALNELHNDSSLELNRSLYLRHQLLNLIIGNTNLAYDEYSWKIVSKPGEGRELVPYVKLYDNQFMRYEGTYKLLTTLIRSYKHFEPYTTQIKSLKNISKKFIGFDVNVLSQLPYEFWETEVAHIKHVLTSATVEAIIKHLPKGVASSTTEELLHVLTYRIANLDAIATAYYNLVSPHKVVVATHANNIIDVKRTNTGVNINIFNEIDGKESPIKAYSFSSADTKNIWIYGLNGNDYFEVSGEASHYIPIKLIGGNHTDKYEVSNGKKVVVYDSKSQSFIVHKDKAKLKLIDEERITTYNETKYKHTTNRVKPKFGANPDDGLFIGLQNEYSVFDFDQSPFSVKHLISANYYMGNQGFNVSYYGEKSNVYKGFNVFTELAYQSPNYSTNFFGFGNDTPNYDDNLKLDYNRVRMEQANFRLGALKHHDNYNVLANIFFESRQIDDTPDRFVSSETLFFPEDDFFDRKNYIGIFGSYQYKNITVPLVDELVFVPSVEVKATANINAFDKINYAVKPSLFFEHPFYDHKISLDAKLSYHHVFGDDLPFYQAASIGGQSGLRGYRNQRFTGQASAVISTNLKWYVKDLESDILPLQFGLLGGFDAGRVWVKKDASTTIHTGFGGGLWLQTADLIKTQLQAFSGNEGLRFSFAMTIGF
ncbi:MAG: ShlB/FhaC/HecB family hemolysin secretion/activation protein [Flavobacteriaceae bacterium]